MQEVSGAESSGERIFVGGRCRHCGAGYLLVVLVGWDWDPGYCCTACARAARRARRARRCPTPQCDRELVNPRAVVCGPCWGTAASMCLGKRRLSEPVARYVAEQRELDAYWCRCCGWWHNGHQVDDGEALIAQVGLILEGMRQARGAPWVLELIESWDPAVRSREEWIRSRPGVVPAQEGAA